MCETCGCGDSELVSVDLHARILAENDAAAAHNREHFVRAGVYSVNLMGSPGAGKTALLEATAKILGGERRIGAASGDLATDNDARRLDAAGISPAVSITTGSACHLDARLVHDRLHGVDWRATDYFFIENVGNLVCPAIYDLGQAVNVVALSVTEGVDKPVKYPVMFRATQLVVVTKIDLLPHLPDVSLDAIRENLARVMPEPKMIALSAVSGEGVRGWTDWLESRRGQLSR